jgi:hypothetical protein
MPFGVYDRENGRGHFADHRFRGLSGVPGLPGWVCGHLPCGSGRGGGRAAGGSEQVQPFVCAVPALGHVQRDVAAAVPGGAGGDVDEVAADGDTAGLA